MRQRVQNNPSAHRKWRTKYHSVRKNACFVHRLDFGRRSVHKRGGFCALLREMPEALRGFRRKCGFSVFSGGVGERIGLLYRKVAYGEISGEGPYATFRARPRHFVPPWPAMRSFSGPSYAKAMSRVSEILQKSFVAAQNEAKIPKTTSRVSIIRDISRGSPGGCCL